MIRQFKNYSENELKLAGVTFGNNVHISTDVIIHNPHNLIIGNNVRIDTQCVLVCGNNTTIHIGNNIHISIGCYYYGNSGNIILEDYTCTSANCILYTSNDDYINGYATNSCVDNIYRKLTIGDIKLKRHSIVGCKSVILPGVILEYATSVGANSLVNCNTNPFDIVAGTPIRFIKKRKNITLNL